MTPDGGQAMTMVIGEAMTMVIGGQGRSCTAGRAAQAARECPQFNPREVSRP